MAVTFALIKLQLFSLSPKLPYKIKR